MPLSKRHVGGMTFSSSTFTLDNNIKSKSIQNNGIVSLERNLTTGRAQSNLDVIESSKRKSKRIIQEGTSSVLNYET